MEIKSLSLVQEMGEKKRPTFYILRYSRKAQDIKINGKEIFKKAPMNFFLMHQANQQPVNACNLLSTLETQSTFPFQAIYIISIRDRNVILVPQIARKTNAKKINYSI